jgi:hypothetical protein
MDRGDDAGGVPVSAARRLPFVVALSLIALAAPARGQDVARVEQTEAGLRRWAVGLQAGPLDVPRGHLGVPFSRALEGYHLAIGFVGRWRVDDRMALNAGVGLPQSGVGLSVWVGHELFARLARDRRGIAALEVYEDAGVSLGFAGPDYYARHEDVFVGYGYAVGGPLAFGLRIPVGLRVTWMRGAFDTYAEPATLLMITPSVEALFELAVGFRVRL